MKTAIGSVPLYNIIIIFIVITFGFLSATLSYVKAFKVNSNIAKQLERYEGYNDLSEKEIENILGTLGYRKGKLSDDCPKKMKQSDLKATYKMNNYPVCLYESKLGVGSKQGDRYFNYGILTYIYMDIPILGGTFKVPVYSESERIFRFSS